jgi:hypothetical protein
MANVAGIRNLQRLRLAGRDETKCVATKVGVVAGPMHIVAAVAAHSVRVHGALHEIVALHAILVRGAAGEVRERLSPELVLPVSRNSSSPFPPETDRPIVVLAIDRIREGLTLRVALKTHICGLNGVQPRRVDDIRPGRLICLQRGPGRPLHVVGRIKRNPLASDSHSGSGPSLDRGQSRSPRVTIL